MCGITGFIDYSARVSAHVLTDMTDALGHRGPDDTGAEIFHTPYAHVALGHRRLSIIDLSPAGHQPMQFEHLRIIFNGEIYNFNEIRQELISLGHTFKSTSDTEMILHAYLQWGEDCVTRFIGMFAMVLLDTRANEVLLFRDRAGVKPLYYYVDNDVVLFASELKTFHKHPLFKKEINLSALKLYLNYGYVPAPHTIFTNAHKVPPGARLRIQLSNRSIDEKIYWNAIDQYNKPKLNISYEDAKEELRRLFISAFQYRMVADVPVGVFLSGGYDSSAVAGILQKHSPQRLKTFTIGFHEKGFDEAVYARTVANQLGTDHVEHYCSVQEALDIIPSLPFFFDEPFGDSSAIPTILVSRLAVKDVKVALSADAGDEIFAGYGRYRTELATFQKFQRMPGIARATLRGISDLGIKTNVSKWLSRVYNLQTRLEKVNTLLSGPQTIVHYNNILQQYFTEIHASRLLVADHVPALSTYFDEAPLASMNDDMSMMLATDYRTFMLDDILTKVDRATMSVSLEGREPLLDHRILEFAARLPITYKDNGVTAKRILKDIVHDYVPKELVDRPKMGFGVPVEIWLKEGLKPLLNQYLDPELIRRQGLFSVAEVQHLKMQYLNSDKLNANINKLWFVLMFQMWYEKWMK